MAEYGRGQGLDALSRPMPWEKALENRHRSDPAARPAAHRQGVLHRDIKPANAILADGDEVKLIDFGVADTGAIRSKQPTPAFRSKGTEASSKPLRGAAGESTLDFSGGQLRSGARVIGTPRRTWRPSCLRGGPASLKK